MEDSSQVKTIAIVLLLLTGLIGMWVMVLHRYTDWLPF